jgi:hypothetical protein
MQALLQNPQCSIDVARSVSHPLLGSPSQSPLPGSQLEIPHTPAAHTGVPLGAGHTLPQPPQWLGLLCRLVSHPLCGSLSQSAKPGLHAWMLQVPATHAAVALASTQLPQSRVVPQPEGAVPQLGLSETQLFGVQPHWLATPAPPHTFGAGQVPQSSTVAH